MLQSSFHPPMVTSLMKPTRRQFLLQAFGVALCAALPLPVRSENKPLTTQLLAAWQLPNGQHQVGVIQCNSTPAGARYQIGLAVDVPTRPHGLMHLQEAEYLVLARRPGDWMMRLNVATGETSRIWQEEGRHLNGHSAVLGELMYTTETDVLSGSGMLGVRNRSTAELLDVWPTHGKDPHQLLVLPEGGLGISQPLLLVANGGLASHPDMGRTPQPNHQIDSSVLALNPRTGEVLKKWTLDDPLLSLRHMAQHNSGLVGIAMQAQHSNSEMQQNAPVLALLDQHGLRVAEQSVGVKGYAGDIAATPEGFAVSCTKNDSVARFDLQGKLLGGQTAKAACALAFGAGELWLGSQSLAVEKPIELDNHWLMLNAFASGSAFHQNQTWTQISTARANLHCSNSF